MKPYCRSCRVSAVCLSRGPLTEEQMHALTQGYVDAMTVIQQHQGNANLWNGPWKPWKPG